MSATIPLPETIRNKTRHNTHPSLELDKYAASYLIGGDDELQKLVQKPTIEKVVKLSQAPPDKAAFDSLGQRREAMLAGLVAERFVCTTTGPLTLHLARASALENAGICLHHIYGFAYLPGSGLKGMARAFAETVWLPAIETEKATAAKKILAVFGNKPQVKPFECGRIVFHDAWPQQWPKLFIDIVNNHHPDYYNQKDAPGDWENPIPVYFMAVTSGVPFSFALSLRRGEVDPDLLKLAREWLLGALCHMGAGAKTNAGYGNFMPTEGPKPSLPQVTRRVFETEVELVTPAFLAGASQDQSDCDLRSATLRGLLRWWWRTLHAGHVVVDRLREMEAVLWGDTKASGAIRLSITTSGSFPAGTEYMKRSIQKIHVLQLSPNKKTTQGLFYLSYGMDDGGRQRFYLPPGIKWKICFTASAIRSERYRIPVEIFLDQAKSALWLLCQFGGVGSKGRKGFGSLQFSLNGLSLSECKNHASEYRSYFGVDTPLDEPTTPAIEKMIPPLEIVTPWKDAWFALDQLGFSSQSFAQKHKHLSEKMALGLPRKIGRPVTGYFSGPRTNRHASPAHFHLSKNEARQQNMWVSSGSGRSPSV